MIRKIEEQETIFTDVKICRSPEHYPPTHLYLDPGKYEHACPACGKKTIFTVPIVSFN